MRSILSAALFATLLTIPVLEAAGNAGLFYVGTYTRGKSKGIYAFRFDPKTGKAEPLGLMAKSADPSFLTIHPNGRFLYAVNEEKDGTVTAYSIEPGTGKLTQLNQQSTKGAGPCHLTVDHTGKNLLIANYGAGSIASLPINPDGSLLPASAAIQHHGSSVDPKRQSAPHAHSINMTPDNRNAIVTDLGLDEVLVYHFDPAKGTLTPGQPAFAKTADGAGPRHLAFHPNGRFAFVNTEMGSTVTTFAWDPAAASFRKLGTVSTLPAGYKGESTTAEIAVDAPGKFVYVSNRGHDSIAVFAVDSKSGTLTPVDHTSTQGKTPRHFQIDPTGNFLLAENQDSDNVVIFRRDAKTGKLTPAGQTLDVGAPVCIQFLPAK